MFFVLDNFFFFWLESMGHHNGWPIIPLIWIRKLKMHCGLMQLLLVFACQKKISLLETRTFNIILLQVFTPCLTLSWQRPSSYTNQSIDLLWKSMDRFLYDNGLHHERVKKRHNKCETKPRLKLNMVLCTSTETDYCKY